APRGRGQKRPGCSRSVRPGLHIERRTPRHDSGGAGCGIERRRPGDLLAGRKCEKGIRYERASPDSAHSGRTAMLTMLEEVVLLAVDERNGDLRSVREYSTAYALVGAVFFDLALARRIDTGTDEVQIIDTTPTGNPTLDRVLAHMAGRRDLNTVSA